MTPALRLSVSLVLSLLLWLPTVPSALAASEDPAMIALRYLVALLISRLGVGLVFRVVSGYAGDVLAEAPQEEATTPSPASAAPADVVEQPGRRREDQSSDDNEDEPEELLDEALEEVRDTAAMVP